MLGVKTKATEYPGVGWYNGRRWSSCNCSGEGPVIEVRIYGLHQRGGIFAFGKVKRAGAWDTVFALKG